MNEYQTLYRKYRPGSFDDVKGQDVVIKTLKNILQSSKISHAYLFSGPRGVGKTSVARIFASTLNCQHTIDKTKICDLCKSPNLDIIELDAASNNGIESVKSMVNNIDFQPATHRYKIYIVDEVHMMTKGAFNALLKTLEEPPAHAIFIFATTDLKKVPLTIISRLQVFNFKKILNSAIEKQLSEILTKENILYTKPSLALIAKMAAGSMRDALSIVEQIAAFSENNIDEKIVNEIFSLVSLEKQVKLINYIYQGQIEKTTILLNKIEEMGLNIENLITDLITDLKDYLIFNETNNDNFLENLSLEDFSDLDINNSFALEFIDLLIEILNNLKYNEIPENVFRIKLIQMTFKQNKNQTKNLSESEKINKKLKEVLDLEDIIETKEKYLNLNTAVQDFADTTRIDKIKFEAKEKNNSLNSNNEFNELTNNKTDVYKQQETLVKENSSTELIENFSFDTNNTNEDLKNQKAKEQAILEEANKTLLMTNEISANEESLTETIISSLASEPQDLEVKAQSIISTSEFNNPEIITKTSESSKVLNTTNVNTAQVEELTKENTTIDKTNINDNLTKASSFSFSIEEKKQDIEEDKQDFEKEINDLYTEEQNLDPIIDKKLIVGLIFEVDKDLLETTKTQWSTLPQYNDPKFKDYILYLNDIIIVGVGNNFMLVSAKKDDLIDKIKTFTNQKNFRLLIESITGSPKHFIAIKREEFTEAKKDWQEVISSQDKSKKDAYLVHLPELKSRKEAIAKDDEIAKKIFGDIF